MFHIILAEDDKNLNLLLSKNLEIEGFKVERCYNGKEALDKIVENDYDLLISDIMMPGLNGNDLICRIKEVKKDMPIIMITALDSVSDKKVSFEYGADDYLTKPINFEELIIRIRALLRRYNLVNERTIKHKDIVLDFNKFSVNINNQEINLSKKEFLVLYKLMSNPGRIYSREDFLNEIWGQDSFSIDRTVDVHINRIREKIISKNIEIISVRGLGYKVELK